jgi:hypothetical protein
LFAGYGRHWQALALWNNLRRIPAGARRAGAAAIGRIPFRFWTGVDSLIGLVLGRVEAGRTQQVLDDRDDWFDALADVFGVSLLDVDAERRDALWRKTLTAHEAWTTT